MRQGIIEEHLKAISQLSHHGTVLFSSIRDLFREHVIVDE